MQTFDTSKTLDRQTTKEAPETRPACITHHLCLRKDALALIHTGACHKSRLFITSSSHFPLNIHVAAAAAAART
ncbi:hypothetical protein Pcinc_028119, partial [Petrolisthes cinctipes]